MKLFDMFQPTPVASITPEEAKENILLWREKNHPASHQESFVTLFGVLVFFALATLMMIKSVSLAQIKIPNNMVATPKFQTREQFQEKLDEANVPAVFSNGTFKYLWNGSTK